MSATQAGQRVCKRMSSLEGGEPTDATVGVVPPILAPVTVVLSTSSPRSSGIGSIASVTGLTRPGEHGRRVATCAISPRGIVVERRILVSRPSGGAVISVAWVTGYTTDTPFPSLEVRSRIAVGASPGGLGSPRREGREADKRRSINIDVFQSHFQLAE